MTSFFPPQISSNAASVPTYANFASLPLSGTQGDLAITLDTNTLYEYTGTVWGAVGTAGSTIVAVADTAKIDLTNAAGTLSATVVPLSLGDGDVSTSAAIALTKLAAVTASRALTSDASGYVSASSVTSTELGYVSGVSSAIQTQINSKAPSASPTFTGTITVPVGPGVMKASILGTVSASSIVDSDVSASAAIAVTKIANGTANQLVGANAAGSANEFKTLATGTTGSDFAITHSAGGVAFNLPDAGASARGVVTTGTQTLAGAKTLSGITTVSNTTSSNTPSNGALVVSGGAGVAGQLTAAVVQVGTVGTAAGAINISQGAGTTLVDNYGPTPTGNHGSLNFTFRYSDGGGALTPFTITPTNFTVSSTNAKITAAYNNTTASVPNVFVASDGSLSRATTAIAPSASPTFTGTVTFPTTAGILHSSAGGVISSSTIVNADVNASAAIDGSKIVSASASVSGVVTTGTQTLAGDKTLTGVTIVNNSTPSTSTSTGALTVAGGVGVAGALNVAGAGKFADSVIVAGAATNPAAGQGCLGVAGSVLYMSQIGSTAGAAHNGVINLTAYDSAIANGKSLLITSGGVYVPGTTASTSPTTGALTVAGGLGVGGGITTDNVTIKVKRITGTTGATQGDIIAISHGIANDKILGWVSTVNFTGSGSTSSYVTENHTYTTGYQYNIYNEGSTGSLNVMTVTGNSSQILSKPVSILIYYTT